MSSSSSDKEALEKKASKKDEEEEKKEAKQTELEKARSKEKAKAKEKSKSARALSPNAKTRNTAGFSLESKSSPEAGTIEASQAQHTAQLSRTQMVRGVDEALAAQGRPLSLQVLVLLY